VPDWGSEVLRFFFLSIFFVTVATQTLGKNKHSTKRRRGGGGGGGAGWCLDPEIVYYRIPSMNVWKGGTTKSLQQWGISS